MNRFKKVLRKSSTSSSTLVSTPTPPSPPPDPPTRLSIAPELVSAHEQRLFEPQWIELDPFNLGYVDLVTLCTFLRQNLPPPLISQLIDLFVPFTNEWDQGQMYALFRLMCHVKQGRQVNADLIYLPAPPELDLPRNRSFSDPSITVGPSLDLTYERHSVDIAFPPPLLLMEPFAPSPAKQSAILLNAKPNSAHQPPPPVPPQHTKPNRLSHLTPVL